MALERIHINPELLECAIVDGINIYVNDVLRAKGVINEQVYDRLSEDLEKVKHAVARQLVARWENSRFDKDA
jgi:hypothetical protein